MKFKEYDVVRIKKDYKNIKKGSIGVIVMVFDNPNEAYEVEVVDEDGNVVEECALLPDYIEKV